MISLPLHFGTKISKIAHILTRKYVLRKTSTCCTKEKSLPVLLDLNCKVVAITGGTGDIGIAITNELLKEKIKHVALLGLDNVKGKETVDKFNCTYGKNKAIFIKCDVKMRDNVKKGLDTVHKEFGKIDVLINAAGIWSGCDWMNELGSNLIGTINTNYLAPAVMSKPGFILNLSGLPGLSPLNSAPTLSAGFAGIISFSRVMGCEANYKKYGLRTMVLCLGVTADNFHKEAAKHAYNAEMGMDIQAFLCMAKIQSAFSCGKAAVYLIKHGHSGGVFILDEARLELMNYSDWRKNCTFLAQFC